MLITCFANFWQVALVHTFFCCVRDGIWTPRNLRMLWTCKAGGQQVSSCLLLWFANCGRKEEGMCVCVPSAWAVSSSCWWRRLCSLMILEFVIQSSVMVPGRVPHGKSLFSGTPPFEHLHSLNGVFGCEFRVLLMMTLFLVPGWPEWFCSCVGGVVDVVLSSSWLMSCSLLLSNKDHVAASRQL